MSLSLDGNVVNGFAKAGQSFYPIVKNNDGSLNLNGQTYKQISEKNGALTVNGKDYYSIPSNVTFINTDTTADFPTVYLNGWKNETPLSNGYNNPPLLNINSSYNSLNCIGIGYSDDELIYYFSGTAYLVNGFNTSLNDSGAPYDFDDNTPIGVPAHLCKIE